MDDISIYSANTRVIRTQSQILQYTEDTHTLYERVGVL